MPVRRAHGADVIVALMPGVVAGGPADVDPLWLQERLAEAIPVIGRPVSRVSVLLVGDEEMRRLHRSYLGIDETTDVLTFPASEPGEAIDTDIAVCLDVAAREAAARGHGLAREVLLYAVHGVLHCAGFDDHDEAASAAMHEEEDRILGAIGVGPTYAAPRRSEDESGSSRRGR